MLDTGHFENSGLDGTLQGLVGSLTKGQQVLIILAPLVDCPYRF